MNPDLASATLPGDELHAFLATAPEKVPFAGEPVRMLTRFADVKAFFTDDAIPGGTFYRSAIEPVVGRTFISMDGAEHDRHRQQTMPAFRSRTITRFVDEDLVPLAHEIVDRFADRRHADLVAELTNVLPFWAISRKLGLPSGSEERQRHLAHALLTGAATGSSLAAAREVSEILAPAPAERRTDPRDDVLSHLLTAGLDDEEIASHIRLLYAVGATTTSDAMSNLFHALLTRPALLERVRDEPALRPRTVHEVLRYEPPVAVCRGCTTARSSSSRWPPPTATRTSSTIRTASTRTVRNARC